MKKVHPSEVVIPRSTYFALIKIYGTYNVKETGSIVPVLSGTGTGGKRQAVDVP